MEENQVQSAETSKEATAQTAQSQSAQPQTAQQASPQQVQIPNEELGKLINGWFINIRGLVRVTKEKDANLYKMNNELQAYRNGFTKQLFKSMAQYIINFREDCAKSLRDCDEYALKSDDVIKYIGYVAQDFDTFLENIGVEQTENGILLNGKNIDATASDVKVFEVPPQTAAEEGESVAKVTATQQEVMDYLEEKTQEIKKILQDNANLDLVVGEYVKQAGLIERNEQQIVLYPVIRELVQYNKEIHDCYEQIMADTAQDEGVLLVAYKDMLGRVINGLESVLQMCGIVVENALAQGNVYDPKRHRIMKFIPLEADKAEQNGQIVKVYSDCYIWDDKVFYAAKVDVYKVK
jgi:molecular chaperone GrpE (heat shock protein)